MDMNTYLKHTFYFCYDMITQDMVEEGKILENKDLDRDAVIELLSKPTCPSRRIHHFCIYLFPMRKEIEEAIPTSQSAFNALEKRWDYIAGNFPESMCDCVNCKRAYGIAEEKSGNE